MNRRQLLTTGAAVTAATVAGCLGGDDEQGDDEQADGYATESFGGTDVPLAPLEDVHEWYEGDEARFVDTRSQHAYDELHIEGAVFSPAATGLPENDPVEEWATDETIVTYCVCPHTMAGQRAAALIDDGYEDVYALDEGLQAWVDAGYPITGDDVSGSLPAYEVRGRTDPAYEGEYAWVRDPVTGQREPGQIDTDGHYEMTLHFTDLEDDSLLEVEAPDYTRELTLEELTSDVVTA